MRLVYYSLVAAGDEFRERQLIQSIRSLRRYNRDIAACLVAYDGVPAFLQEEARRSDVAIYDAGNYREHLQRLHVRGDVLAQNPTLHKVLSLRTLPLGEVSQVLYLDCDTFFFQDVNRLFEMYDSCHWCTREEPHSRRSHYGYKPHYVDESMVQQIACHERLQVVAPCNTGVCLLNHGLWWRLLQLEITYLDFAWRLMVGLYSERGRIPPEEQEMGRTVLDTADSFDHSRAIQFPSSNPWIVEEIALWLTLGHISGLTQDFFRREHVMQGGEFFESPHLRDRAVAAHYFSNSKKKFFTHVAALG